MDSIKDSDDRYVFECVGYMKAKMPGENAWSMFVNENAYGRMGGFEWNFLDYCPPDVVDHRRIFVHLMSYDEIKKKVLHEAEMERLGCNK